MKKLIFAIAIAAIGSPALSDPCLFMVPRYGYVQWMINPRCLKFRGQPAMPSDFDHPVRPEPIPPPPPVPPVVQVAPPPAPAPSRQPAGSPGGWNCKTPSAGHTLDCRKGTPQ